MAYFERRYMHHSKATLSTSSPTRLIYKIYPYTIVVGRAARSRNLHAPPYRLGGVVSVSTPLFRPVPAGDSEVDRAG